MRKFITSNYLHELYVCLPTLSDAIIHFYERIPLYQLTVMSNSLKNNCITELYLLEWKLIIEDNRLLLL